MNFSRFFNHERTETNDTGAAKGLEHIAPTGYFTPERRKEIEETLGKLDSIRVDAITPL